MSEVSTKSMRMPSFLCIITLSSKGTLIETIASFENAGSGRTNSRPSGSLQGFYFCIAKYRTRAAHA